MPHINATVQYFTDQFRTRTNQQLRRAIAFGLPWPEHIAAHAILRERAGQSGGFPRSEHSIQRIPFRERLQRAVGKTLEFASRVAGFGGFSPRPQFASNSLRTAISSVRILGKVAANPLRHHARVGERPHNVAT